VTAKYDIKALIGRGTFSRVVRVEHRITRQPYAIKMVDRNRGREMCEAELVVLRRVRHNYIIRLIEVTSSSYTASDIWVNSHSLCQFSENQSFFIQGSYRSGKAGKCQGICVVREISGKILFLKSLRK